MCRVCSICLFKLVDDFSICTFYKPVWVQMVEWMLPICSFYLVVNRWSSHLSLYRWLIECCPSVLSILLSIDDLLICLCTDGWLNAHVSCLSCCQQLILSLSLSLNFFLSGYLPCALVRLEPSVEGDGGIDVRREVSGHVEHRHPQRARRPQHRLPVGRDLACDAQVGSIHVGLKNVLF